MKDWSNQSDIWFEWTKLLDFLYTKEFNYNLFKYNDHSTITGPDLDSVFLTFFFSPTLIKLKFPLAIGE